MKNILSCLLAITAIAQVHASSMNWKLQTSSTGEGSSIYAILGTSTDGITFTSVSDITSSEGILTSSAGDKLLGTVQAVSGGRTGTSYYTSGSISHNSLLDTSSYFYVLVNSASDGYWISDVYSAAGKTYDPPASAPSVAVADVSSKTLTYTSFSAVPEPATGALALAGIALLLKRRKAVKA